MKKSIGIVALLLFSSYIYSQNCAVEMQSLKGTYTGDCKKGKANGKGKAVGKDTYEGEFKSGWPDGKGIYSWGNGNKFTGQFVNGSKEGKGTMQYKRENAADSIVAGFWKNDVYTGPDETTYRIIYKSKAVNDVEVEQKQDGPDRITFIITNTSGGAKFADGNEMPKMKIDEIIVIHGSHGRLYYIETYVKKTESVIENISFPIRFRAIIGDEEVEMEFKAAGNYIITLRIND